MRDAFRGLKPLLTALCISEREMLRFSHVRKNSDVIVFGIP